MSFEELNVPKNHIYLFKPQLTFVRRKEHKIQHAKCGFWYNYYELGRAHAGFHGKAQDHRMKSESKRKILVAGMGGYWEVIG